MNVFDIYGREVTSTKAQASQRRDAVCMRMFLSCFGGHRNPATLSQIDWDRFIRERRSGRIGHSGKPVSNSTIAGNLAFLITVLNWATRSRDDQGGLFLQSNPLKGLKKPVQKNPTRVVITEPEYQALLGVSLEVDWRFRVALVLAYETGHRIGAIRQLRWSDVDFERGAIRWRAEHEKTGFRHVTPATAEAIAALGEARKRTRGIGDALVLPHTKDPLKCTTNGMAAGWWRKAVKLAGLEPKRGRGWHSLRRKFASDLMDQPYVDAPGWASVDSERVGGSLVRYCRMCGLLMRLLLAAGPYGVREIGSKSLKRAQWPPADYWFSRPRLLDRLPLLRSFVLLPTSPGSFSLSS